jgi:hypothetical protein
MTKPNNGRDPSTAHAQPKPKRHNAKYCSFSNRERIVNALAAGDPKTHIASALRVSYNTVIAVAEQEWQQVETRKARIAAQFERIATKSCELLAQKLETDGHKLTANQLVPIAGVATDKLLVLRGEANIIAHVDHTVHVGNIFEAFQRYHDDAKRILQAREIQPPALPDQPPTPDQPQTD